MAPKKLDTAPLEIVQRFGQIDTLLGVISQWGQEGWEEQLEGGEARHVLTRPCQRRRHYCKWTALIKGVPALIGRKQGKTIHAGFVVAGAVNVRGSQP